MIIAMDTEMATPARRTGRQMQADSLLDQRPCQPPEFQIGLLPMDLLHSVGGPQSSTHCLVPTLNLGRDSLLDQGLS